MLIIEKKSVKRRIKQQIVITIDSVFIVGEY